MLRTRDTLRSGNGSGDDGRGDTHAGERGRAMTGPVRVLQSFKTPRETTNPYIHMLRQSLVQQDGVEVLDFSWRAALIGRYDVFHMHWPEILVASRRPLTTPVRQLFFLLILIRTRLQRIALVRTQHNVGLPSGLSRRQRLLLTLADRMTTWRIALNPYTPFAPGQKYDLIAHGDYRNWFARYSRADPIPGRLTFTGLIRGYKGVDQLIDAFRATARDGDARQLRIAGLAQDADLRARLERAADADPRVSLRFEFLDDDQFVQEITSAELVVLPYSEMHNSGAALAALSLGRPILVPDNKINRDLADEVGVRWVHLFTGPLSPDDLTGALKRLRADPPEQPPDLSARGWAAVGRTHLLVYRKALSASHRRRSGRSSRSCGAAWERGVTGA